MSDVLLTLAFSFCFSLLVPDADDDDKFPLPPVLPGDGEPTGVPECSKLMTKKSGSYWIGSEEGTETERLD